MNELKLKTWWNPSQMDIEFSCNTVTCFYGQIAKMDADELEHFRKKLNYPENVNVQKLLREDVYKCHLKDIGFMTYCYEDIDDSLKNKSNDSGISANGRLVTHPESFCGDYSGSYEQVASGSNITDVSDGNNEKVYVNDEKPKQMSRHSFCSSVHSNDRTEDKTSRPLSCSSVHSNDRTEDKTSRSDTPVRELMKFPPSLPPAYKRNENTPPLPPRNEHRNSKNLIKIK